MNQIETIIEKVKQADLSTTSCKARPVGCPMQRNCSIELQQLSKYQFHAAFILKLFGNNGHAGIIIENGKAN